MDSRLQEQLHSALHSVVIGDSECVLLPFVFSFSPLRAAACLDMHCSKPHRSNSEALFSDSLSVSDVFPGVSLVIWRSFLCLFYAYIHRPFPLKNSSKLIGLFVFIALYLFPHGPGCNSSSYAVWQSVLTVRLWRIHKKRDDFKCMNFFELSCSFSFSPARQTRSSQRLFPYGHMTPAVEALCGPTEFK